MISWDLALALRDAGLRWSPRSGDRFRLLATGPAGDVYTVSDMTIEPHEFDTGVILGFNGTTEWALDSVALEDTLWHPLEDQLRDLLRGTFRSLEHAGDEFVVRTAVLGDERRFVATEPADAYARALLDLVTASADDGA
ncbi:pilus assembly protein CpaE [Cellulosimicrobium sp. CUA-896]|uniref:pilus assembly protein CpaE n=1 Tax=Cellulosimicrobium sp. CUA-896 TaxID=1517881 RepID=UPI0009609048|nr:pilus assembly protein CpaE [Cellulosimicrobium sp. CUA-896]OLT50976.1 pilus assembly protein CpaE [Cellulosimicrobium sp. CUA-896]